MSAERRELRVAWRRSDGGRLRSKRVPNEAKGRSLARFLLGDFDDPDAFACCDGHECGCGGLTNREAWEAYTDTHGRYQQDEVGAEAFEPLAPITWGPVIQSRVVTKWGDIDVEDEADLDAEPGQPL